MSDSKLFMLILGVVFMGAYSMIMFDLIKSKDKKSKLKALSKYNKKFNFIMISF